MESILSARRDFDTGRNDSSWAAVISVGFRTALPRISANLVGDYSYSSFRTKSTVTLKT